ncbi:MAG: hypothetical protein IH831_02840, partial [Planctomycetes bacterium]|nr:hypothetical protein [Planctomycetota bacterium]
MSGNINITNWLLGIVGGIVGGALGYLAFFLMARQGVYAIVLPGALLGLGCRFLSGFKSYALGVASGLLALLLGFFAEWRFAPFIADGSFAYFITHALNLKTMTLVMIAIGSFFGFWFG